MNEAEDPKNAVFQSHATKTVNIRGRILRKAVIINLLTAALGVMLFPVDRLWILVPLALAFLCVLEEHLNFHRLEKGYFGTNKREAKLILDLLAEPTDFS